MERVASYSTIHPLAFFALSGVLIFTTALAARTADPAIPDNSQTLADTSVDPAQQQEALRRLRLPDDIFNVEGLDKADNRLRMRALYNQAVILNYSDQYGQIRPLLHSMNRLSPNAPETSYLRSMDFYHSGQMARAIVEARKAVDANPALDPAWNFLGYLHVKAGNDSKALDAFLQAIKANPYHAVYRFNAATVFSRQGEIEEAHEQIKQAIRIRSNYADAYYLQALIFAEEEKHDEAFESMLLAEKAGSNDVAFFMNFIDVARRADKPEKLLELMETTRSIRDHRLFRMRGIVFSEYGECSRAIPLLRIVPHEKMSMDAYRAYGKCLLIQNQSTGPFLKAWKLSDDERNQLAAYFKDLEITNKKWPEVKDPIVSPPK
jgi:tetratricopeptide (TPR) repeat protein